MDIVTVLDRAGRRHPGRPFLTDHRSTVDYASAVRRSIDLAAVLQSHGVQPGGTVGICAQDQVEAWIAIFATWRLGALPSLIDARTPADRLRYYVEDVDAPLTLADAECVDALVAAGSRRVEVLADVCRQPPSVQVSGAASGALSGAVSGAVSVHHDESPVFLSYTSGTTGDPKGAVLQSGPCTLATSCIAERLGYRRDDVLVATTPIASSFQLVAAIMPAMHVGAHVVLCAGRSVPEICDAMAAHRATVLVAYPLTLADVVATVDPTTVTTLRLALSGGSPLAPRIKRDYDRRLAIPLVESYGQSELGGFMAMGSPAEASSTPSGYAGRSLPDRLAYIAGIDGGEAPPGDPGEVVVAEGYFAGYRNKSSQYAAATAGGVLHTGDIGVADEDGFFKVLGRTREAGVAEQRGGYLRDVEDVAYDHPGVRHAAVVERDGYIVCFVECEPDCEVSEADLLDHITQHVSSGLAPKALRRLDAMPRTFSGKTDRLRLATMEHA